MTVPKLNTEDINIFERISCKKTKTEKHMNGAFNLKF